MPTPEERLDAIEDLLRDTVVPSLGDLRDFQDRVTDVLREMRQGKIRALEGGKALTVQEQLTPDELAALAWLVGELKK